ncbi:unnamed protein product [Withania somnifera]
MEVYKRWIRRNKDFVRQVDSLVNNLTWFLPDEFAESEIGPEAVSSLVGIITTVNEYIIETSRTEVHTRCAVFCKLVERPSLRTFLSEKGIPGGLFVTGEILFIIRPLVYVLLMRKYGTRSWFPWCVSLAVDLIRNSILSVTLMSQHSRKNQQLHFSDSEKAELKRRRMLWALYLVLDPPFTKYTRLRLESTQRLVQPVPVLGFVAEKLIEILIGVQTRYTYTSG